MTKVRNRQTPIGIETGEHLARFTDKAEQMWREAGMSFIPVSERLRAHRGRCHEMHHGAPPVLLPP